jgi:hypothetical protein
MEVNGRVMLNNSNHDLDSAYGLTMPNRLKFIATGPGVAGGIFCAISLDSNSAVSPIGETISQREDPYLAEIDYTLLAPARCRNAIAGEKPAATALFPLPRSVLTEELLTFYPCAARE